MKTRAQLIADGIIKPDPTPKKGPVKADVQSLLARRGECPRVRKAMEILNRAANRGKMEGERERRYG
jgi:hypothetical protein